MAESFPRPENAVGKGGIAHYEQFLLFPQCFQKTRTPDTQKPGLVWETMAHPLLFDGTWLQQNKYEAAEAFYQRVLAGTNSEATQSPNNPTSQKKGSNKSEGSKLKSEIAQARQNIQKALTEGGAKETSGAVDPQVLQRIKTLEDENKNLKQTSQDLTALVKKLEARISALEKSNSGSNPAPTEAPKPVAAGDDDEDIDLFDDSDESEDEGSAARLAALQAYHSKKAKKPAVVAKSSLLLDVKPWDDETDMKELEAHVRSIEADGLIWGQGKLVEVGYGIKKLQINAVIEDDKISTDFLEEEITKFEDHVQSMDIAAFNKI